MFIPDEHGISRLLKVSSHFYPNVSKYFNVITYKQADSKLTPDGVEALFQVSTVDWHMLQTYIHHRIDTRLKSEMWLAETLRLCWCTEQQWLKTLSQSFIQTQGVHWPLPRAELCLQSLEAEWSLGLWRRSAATQTTPENMDVLQNIQNTAGLQTGGA